MTLAVRSENMEHVKSTIVTTAVLVMGLITAAHVLHPRDPASEIRRGKPAIATADAATAWSDPPVRAARAATSETDAAMIRPASFTLLPIAMTASLSGIEDQLQVRPVRTAEHVHGRRSVQAASRSRPAAVEARVEQQASNPSAATAQPGRAAQGDPIGDLLKALGLGRDSQG